MAIKINKLYLTPLFGVACAALVVLLLVTNVFNVWQIRFSDSLQAKIPLNEDIIIVAVDEESVASSGLGSFDDWTRAYFAQVLDNISKYEPKLVAFDFYFKSPKDALGDSLFREALTRAKNPLFFYRMSASKQNAQGYYVQENEDKANPFPYDDFITSNITISTAKAIADEDKVIRKMLPLIFDLKSNQYYENFAFAVARIALNGDKKPETPLVDKDQYLMKLSSGEDFRIPLENGEMIINYSSIPRQKAFPKVSFYDVYKNKYDTYGKTPEELFKDKIVLVGPIAFSFNDLVATPTSKDSTMYGVEIQANALQTILDQAFLRNMTLTEKILLIFVLAILSSFVFLYTKIRWSVLYLVVVPITYWLLTPFVFSKGLILDLVHPYVVFVLTFISVYIYRYLTEFKEKNALKGAFSKYVNPTLAQQIAEHPEELKLGGEKRPVTVLFTDIAHFTTISENLTPESLVALLNEYFDAMSEVILAQGGTLDKFEGDAIMAFFGAPIHYPDHAIRAANAAVGMRHKLNELLKKWASDAPLPGGEKKPVIDFRCGLSSGDVIVGNVGSKERFEYTVMGDIVNLGSRLEGANKKYSTNTMVSEATYLLIKDSFEGRELDTIRVVGKNKPIKVYEILSHKGELPADAMSLLQSYNEGITLYHSRKYAEGLEKFKQILQKFPADGPSKMYVQRCEVLRDFPRPADWDEVFEMGSK